jgi:hypothetical protein
MAKDRNRLEPKKEGKLEPPLLQVLAGVNEEPYFVAVHLSAGS